MKSMSGLAGRLGVAACASVGPAQFESFLPLPVGSVVVVSGVALLVSVWAMGLVPAPYSRVVDIKLLVGRVWRRGEKASSYG